VRDELDDLLGIDRTDPTQELALELVESDDQLLRKLVAVRNQKNLTQGEIGRRMGVTQPAVAALERADADPKLSTLRRYALALGVLIRHTVTDHHFSPGSPLISNGSPSATGGSHRSKWENLRQTSSLVNINH
jgi:transcriptional regulator with XRE-family HTH domain